MEERLIGGPYWASSKRSWRAVLIHEGGVVLPLGSHTDWRAALARCLEHVGTIAPGRYRLDEVGVDLVDGEGLVFATLKHPRGGWIINAVGPNADLPTLEEVQAILKTWGLKSGKRVWLEKGDREEV